MRRIYFTLFVYALGIGTGFYLWRFNEQVVAQKMEQLVNQVPRAQNELERQDVAPVKLSASDITANIIGMWKSSDDTKFTRSFSVDASVVDAYEGNDSATVEGRWAVFTAPEGEPPPFQIPAGTIYLKISSVEEVLYFKVLKLDAETLELAYLDGNGVQKFLRQK